MRMVELSFKIKQGKIMTEHIAKWMMDKTDSDNPYRDGNVYPMTESTIKLLEDLTETLHKLGWDPDCGFEVQTAGTWKKDKFICIKNRNLEQ